MSKIRRRKTTSATVNVRNDIPPSYTKMRYMTCDCGETYFNEEDLQKHFMETDHKIIKRDVSTFQCDICTKTLDSVYNFLQHHTMLHQLTPPDTWRLMCKLEPDTEAESVMCNVCNKVLKNQLSYAMHMTSHMGKKLYPCDLCDFSFTTQRNLMFHLKKTH